MFIVPLRVFVRLPTFVHGRHWLQTVSGCGRPCGWACFPLSVVLWLYVDTFPRSNRCCVVVTKVAHAFALCCLLLLCDNYALCVCVSALSGGSGLVRSISPFLVQLFSPSSFGFLWVLHVCVFTFTCHMEMCVCPSKQGIPTSMPGGAAKHADLSGRGLGRWPGGGGRLCRGLSVRRRGSRLRR